MVYFRLLGRLVLRLFLYLGELASLVGQICESLLQGRKRWRQFFEEADRPAAVGAAVKRGKACSCSAFLNLCRCSAFCRAAI